MINRPLPESYNATDCKLEGREEGSLPGTGQIVWFWEINIHGCLLLNTPLCTAGNTDVPLHRGPREMKAIAKRLLAHRLEKAEVKLAAQFCPSQRACKSPVHSSSQKSCPFSDSTG